MKIILWGVLPLFLFACSTQPQIPDAKIFYRRDMDINVNGFKGTGALVVPKAPQYAFEVSARGNLDLFTFESCHREEYKERAGNRGVLSDKKSVKSVYVPINGVENTGACPVRLGGYEEKKGRHSWAIVDFEDLSTTLPALIKCNGSEWNSRGVTICQSKEGLLQQIEFPVQVVVNPDPGCEIPKPVDKKTFRFPMRKQECVYNFMEINPPHKEHRLTTVGYESILIRED